MRIEDKIEALAEELFTDWAVPIDIELGIDFEEADYHKEWLVASPEIRKRFRDKATHYARHFGLWVPEETPDD